MKKFQENWSPSNIFPDLRLLIIEPSKVKEETLKLLSDVGWGICKVPRLDYLTVG